MGFFKTKDPKTGEPRAGAGVYLIVCALMIGGAVLWHVRKNADNGNIVGQPSMAPVVHNPSDIAPVATAVQEHSDVAPLSDDKKNTAPTSLRNVLSADKPQDITKTDPTVEQEKAEDLSTIEDTLDLLRTNRAKAEKEKEIAAEKARQQAEAQAQAEIEALRQKLAAQNTSAPQGPAAPGQKAPQSFQGFGAAQGEAGADRDSNAFVVYNIDKDPSFQKKVTSPVAVSGFTNGHFLPRGFSFPVYILSTVQSTGTEDIVEMAVAKNVIFGHKVQIPFGTHLLGSAAADSTEDRIMINVDTILYPDGRELPISAFLKDAEDLASGVRGYYIPQPLRVQLTPYINEFIASWTEAAADRYANGHDDDDDDSSDDAVDQTASLIRDEATKMQERLEKRFPEKVVIPIGTKAYVKLRSPLDLEQAAIAGSLKNTQPVLPGFENNPVRPNGTVEQTANYGVNKNAVVTGDEQTDTTDTATTETTQQAKNEAYAKQLAQKQVQSYISNIQSLKNLANSKSSTSSASSTSWPSGDIE